ncbi:MAG: copper chaperone PCu(A)C [Pseudomonadota bacterium]
MRRVLAAILLLAAPAAAADMAVVGDLHIETPMLRATAPNAPVAGGFLRIENTGPTDDVLIEAAIAEDVASTVELHAMAMNDGVMSMFEVEGGIELPAGETVTLMPGGLHIMLMGLQQPLSEGEVHAVTLTFAQAGEITLEMPVRNLGEIRAAFEADGAGHSDAGHGDGHGAHHGN